MVGYTKTQAERLKLARSIQNFSQKKLAELSGVKLHVIARIEGCITYNEKICQHDLDRICSTLEINPDWLVYGFGSVYSPNHARKDTVFDKICDLIYKLSNDEIICFQQMLNDYDKYASPSDELFQNTSDTDAITQTQEKSQTKILVTLSEKIQEIFKTVYPERDKNEINNNDMCIHYTETNEINTLKILMNDKIDEITELYVEDLSKINNLYLDKDSYTFITIAHKFLNLPFTIEKINNKTIKIKLLDNVCCYYKKI